MNRARLAFSISACVVSVATIGTAEAELPPECVERFESVVLGHIAAIEEAMREGVRLPDIGRKLLAVRAEALGYVRGSWAVDCAEAAPGNSDRMNQLATDKLIPALDRNARAFRAVCVEYGQARLDARFAEATTAAAEGRPAAVDAQLRHLDIEILGEPVLAACTPFLSELEEHRIGSFALARKRAVLVSAENNLVACASSIETLERVEQGLGEGKRGNLREIGIPHAGVLERVVAVCRAAIDDVVKLTPNAAALTVSAAGASRRLDQVEPVVTRLVPAELVDKVRAHNRKWNKWFIARWKRENILGAGLPAVFDRFGNPW